ncbi:MAG TPA: MlaD family protein [Baekduia sp.]|nr:MlaD family protein [Baekduia sp.]
MTDVVAKAMAAVTALLLVGVLAVLVVSSQPSADARKVVAQFDDAFPLIEGMNVRVDGAIAGSVGSIDVTEDGLAEVELRIDDQVEAPRADATAAIRQQDTTGDSYVAYEPGRAARALPEQDGAPTIRCDPEVPGGRCRNTLVAPRFDDLLNAFGERERAGIQLVLTELARAVDERGGDLNRAALDLRPALVSANDALTQVNRQNAALRRVIRDAEAVTGQAAARRRSLGRSIDALARTLRATAAETPALDAGLERLPATAARLRSTMASLRGAATAATPLAAELGRGAPALARALDRAPAFLGDLDRFLGRARPTLDLTRRLVRSATPTIEADPERVVTGPFDLAPAISNMLRGVLGEDETIEVLFNEKFGLGAVAGEPGNQQFYPAEHAPRRWLRVSAVLNCEIFGARVRPGCLADLLSAARRADRRGARRREPVSRPRPERPQVPAPAPGRPAAPDRPAPPLPDVVRGVRQAIDGLTGALGARPADRPDRPRPASPQGADGLLDFLLR